MHTTTQPADAEILNTEELARLLECDEETVAKRIIDGDLPGTKFGRGWVIPRQALLQRINEMAMQDAAARRAELIARREEAAQRGKPAMAPPPMLPTAASPTPKRGQRRTPPPLPAVPAGVPC